MAAKPPPAKTPICRLDEIPDGGGGVFSFATTEADEEEFRLLVLRSGDTCYGYENRCPHFGMPLAEAGHPLILKPHVSVTCNVHYARFRWRDGYCEFGDCEGESLSAIPLRVADGTVFVA